ncbi:MAG: superoxide dismutase family protein [Sphingomonadaceae bacterium]
MRTTMIMVATFALGACQSTPGPAAPEAFAVLRDANGVEVGRAALTGAGGQMRLTLDATGLTAGERGVHIHAVGRCDAPKFESAGPHWNPGNRQHGRDNPMGMHQGDLPNLVVGTTLSADVSGGLDAMLDADGASILIHATADDYRTDPSGNSGGRVACGVFARR